MKLQKIFLALLFCGIIGEAAAQTSWYEPIITPIHLDSVRLKKTTDEIYLEQLSSLKEIVKTNDVEIKNCIKQTKTVLETISSDRKSLSQERSFLKNDEKLLNSQKKSREKDNKNLEKELKSLNKSKDYTADEKSIRIASVNARIEKNRQEESIQTQRLGEIKVKYKVLDERERALNVREADAEKRMTMLKQYQESSKLDSSRIKNEIKITKANIKNSKN